MQRATRHTLSYAQKHQQQAARIVHSFFFAVLLLHRIRIVYPSSIHDAHTASQSTTSEHATTRAGPATVGRSAGLLLLLAWPLHPEAKSTGDMHEDRLVHHTHPLPAHWSWVVREAQSPAQQ